MYTLGRRSWVQTSLPPHFCKRLSRKLATFERCPFEGTSFRVHYTFFQGSLSVVSFYELMRVLFAALKFF